MSTERKNGGELPPYVSYLLRLWQETGGERGCWRASLQDPLSGGHRLGFANLDELVSFLREQMGLAPPPEDSVEGGRIPNKGSKSEEGSE